jgi:two-component system, NarL family, response regulator LiaR
MPGSPVRLAIASADEAVTQGLRRMLAEQAHRVVVVDDGYDAVDVVLHDGDIREGELPLRAGAAAWVPLRTGVEQIVAVVEAAARPAPGGGGGAELAGLTGREVEVLELIAEGLTNQEIADRIYISINSVKTYIRSAYRKIGVNSRSQAAVWSLQHGVVQHSE